VKTKTNEVEVDSEKPQSKKAVVESEKSNVPPPYQQKIPFPQRLAKFKLDEQFRKFDEMLKKLNVNSFCGCTVINALLCKNVKRNSF